MGILKTISEVSGQVLNPSKCQIFFSKHIFESSKQQILTATTFKEDVLLTKFFSNTRPNQAYLFLLYAREYSEESRGWTKNLLSISGRLTLVSSVLTSMSLHDMSALPIPKGILKKWTILLLTFMGT